MAYQNTFYVNNVPVTCTGDGDHDWITADFKIEAYANATNTAYDVKVYARIDASSRMNWNGNGDIRVTCNGVKKSAQVTLKMYGSDITTEWDGPATFTFGAPGEVKLTMDLDLDLTRTTGFNDKPGVQHNSDGGNMQHFYYNNFNITIGEDGGLPPLVVAPTISSLTNTNQYNNNTNISASTNSISVKWTESGTVTNRYYKINDGSWVSAASSNIIISNLSAGTDYIVQVKSSNSAGDSNVLKSVIRTRHNAPVVTLKFDSKKIDSLVFKWTSDKALASSQYKVGTGNWVDSGTGTSGTITVPKLRPNTNYTIYFKGVSTSTYDSLSSNESFVSETTLDIAHIVSVGDCVFGNSISIEVDKNITNTCNLMIWVNGNSMAPGFTINVVNGTNVFTPTQNQLDQMYRCFSNLNTIPIHFLLTTVGEWEDFQDNVIQKTLQLTGIVKTAHISIDNSHRRAQAFIGVSDTPRRAIFWVGDENNIPRRCI